MKTVRVMLISTVSAAPIIQIAAGMQVSLLAKQTYHRWSSATNFPTTNSNN